MKKVEDISKEDLLYALEMVVWYNGLGPTIKKLIELEPPNNSRYILCPYELTMDDGCLETIWMICVTLFGDYGTSPRSGWIENIEGYRAFLKSILHEEPEF